MAASKQGARNAEREGNYGGGISGRTAGRAVGKKPEALIKAPSADWISVIECVLPLR